MSDRRCSPWAAVRTAMVSMVLFAGLQAQSITGNARADVLTNKSIVTLASAGFDEQFIADLIASSRTQFDTSVDGLAGLAKQGVNERLIRMMMAASPAGTTPGAGGYSPAVLPPDMDQQLRTVVVHPRSTALAIASHTPYCETRSLFWGLFKRRVGVGVAPQVHDVLLPHLGAMYQRVYAGPSNGSYATSAGMYVP